TTDQSQDSTDAFSLAITMDYLFKGGIYGSAALLYNNQGSRGGSLENGLTGAGNLSARNLFPASWSFLLQGSGNLTPLLSMNVSAIYSPDNNLLIFFPSFTYSIKENWDIDLIGQSFFAQTNGTFGHGSTAAFLRLKWSF
ncbi:MAG: hypothetical protein AAF206_19000, partial [Bacteroidota bacterium]